MNAKSRVRTAPMAISMILVASCAGHEPGDHGPERGSTDLDAMPTGAPVAVPDEGVPVKRADMDLAVADVEAAESEVDSLLRTYGGYIESKDTRDPAPEGKGRMTTFTLKVDAKQFDRFIEAVRKLGECTRESFRVEDVTFAFMDVGARLANQRRAEKELAARLVETGANVAAIQRELAAVREKIELLNARLRFMRDQIAYSTLVLTITEAPGVARGDGCPLSEASRIVVLMAAEALVLVLVFLIILKRRGTGG